MAKHSHPGLVLAHAVSLEIELGRVAVNGPKALHRIALHAAWRVPVPNSDAAVDEASRVEAKTAFSARDSTWTASFRCLARCFRLGLQLMSLNWIVDQLRLQ
jgi:hypothetical protein